MRAPLESLEIASDTRIRLTPRVLAKAFESILIPRSISLLHGSERAPLSTVAHCIAGSAANSVEDAKCIFLDSGTNYQPSLIRTVTSESEALSRILVGTIMSLSDIVEMMNSLSDVHSISLVVIDSLAGALNLSGAPGSVGRQRELFSTLETLRDSVNRFDTHVLITDHSSRNWGSERNTPVGGNVLAHAVDSVVRIDRLRDGNNLIRIQTERCTSSKKPPSIIVRADSKGIRSIK